MYFAQIGQRDLQPATANSVEGNCCIAVRIPSEGPHLSQLYGFAEKPREIGHEGINDYWKEV